MVESKSTALPLGYAPILRTITCSAAFGNALKREKTFKPLFKIQYAKENKDVFFRGGSSYAQNRHLA